MLGDLRDNNGQGREASAFIITGAAKGLGVTALSRLLLSFCAMAGTWLISSGCLLLMQFTNTFLKVGLLSLSSGVVAMITWVCFAAPIMLVSRSAQLRFWLVFVALALAWDSLVLHFLFREWPWSILREPPPGNYWLIWFGGFTACSLGSYLFALWRGARTARLNNVTPP